MFIFFWFPSFFLSVFGVRGLGVEVGLGGAVAFEIGRHYYLVLGIFLVLAAACATHVTCFNLFSPNSASLIVPESRLSCSQKACRLDSAPTSVPIVPER